jgi:nitroreductase
MNSINPIIAERKSELAFSSIPIPLNELYLMFEAARWAPSSYNEQPWRFYFASRENPAGFEKMLGILAPGNQEWAMNASALIITTAKKNVTRNGNENFYAMHDTAMAEANLIFQAQSMGFATHVMGGFDQQAARKVLNISDDFSPVVAIAVGFSGDTATLSSSLLKRAESPRQRKPIVEIINEVK